MMNKTVLKIRSRSDSLRNFHAKAQSKTQSRKGRRVFSLIAIVRLTSGFSSYFAALRLNFAPLRETLSIAHK
jgi:hypothetical protein